MAWPGRLGPGWRWATLDLVAGLILAACATLPSPTERKAVADQLAAARGWQAQPLPAGPFALVAYLPAHPAAADTLTIYLEGDGFAWVTPNLPSSDPTPRNPLALRLALAQPEGAAAYLGRPCQYGDAEATGCAQRYWTTGRFAPEVIAATQRAIDQLKARFSARRLVLVGYSGGGAVAALVASERQDVSRLITVAGNLDHRAWTTLHRVQPLAGSLNPADRIAALGALPQYHYVGERDSNITPALIQAYADRFPAGQRPVVRSEGGFDHQCCWAEAWPRLWRQAAGQP